MICSAAFLDTIQVVDKVWYQGLLFKLKFIFSSYNYLKLKLYRHLAVRIGSVIYEINLAYPGVPRGMLQTLQSYIYLTYALQKSNIKKIQSSQSKEFRKVTKAHPFMSQKNTLMMIFSCKQFKTKLKQ